MMVQILLKTSGSGSIPFMFSMTFSLTPSVVVNMIFFSKCVHHGNFRIVNPEVFTVKIKFLFKLLRS